MRAQLWAMNSSHLWAPAKVVATRDRLVKITFLATGEEMWKDVTSSELKPFMDPHGTAPLDPPAEKKKIGRPKGSGGPRTAAGASRGPASSASAHGSSELNPWEWSSAILNASAFTSNQQGVGEPGVAGMDDVAAAFHAAAAHGPAAAPASAQHHAACSGVQVVAQSAQSALQAAQAHLNPWQQHPSLPNTAFFPPGAMAPPGSMPLVPPPTALSAFGAPPAAKLSDYADRELHSYLHQLQLTRSEVRRRSTACDSSRVHARCGRVPFLLTSTVVCRLRT
jgi:hypothetical protein